MEVRFISHLQRHRETIVHHGTLPTLWPIRDVFVNKNKYDEEVAALYGAVRAIKPSMNDLLERFHIYYSKTGDDKIGVTRATCTGNNDDLMEFLVSNAVNVAMSPRPTPAAEPAAVEVLYTPAPRRINGGNTKDLTRMCSKGINAIVTAVTPAVVSAVESRIHKRYALYSVC